MRIMIPTSPGELFDKITILAIKAKKMTDPHKVRHVKTELEILRGAMPSYDKILDTQGTRTIDDAVIFLREINEELWFIEDRIRECEAEKKFDRLFVELARRIYTLNDVRAGQKKLINIMLGSDIIEEKEY